MSRLFSQVFSFAVEIASLQIPRHAWQSHDQSIELLAHLDLTPQATRLGKSKCQIQHVVLVIIRLLHLVVVGFVFDYDVTC